MYPDVEKSATTAVIFDPKQMYGDGSEKWNHVPLVLSDFNLGCCLELELGVASMVTWLPNVLRVVIMKYEWFNVLFGYHGG
ncbi:hypothetical protein L1987_13516 [Smallanthus sonchifolius]|uniref:Uncharacterized protein n=1 Tax=Smallanthus sonchifolius TaxID=185202 RepID=A0ACB9JGR0_9ASTR|nr:hypothetical protein L1987_13516 [Smallanthus sonchifolius]